MFTLLSTSSTGIRRGRLETPHGSFETPVFMPVATKGSLKALTPLALEELEVSILLGNTYHLMLRPGHERIRRAGGLHNFMRWNHPILTDSGGYQVFSLGERLKRKGGKESLVHISEEGVEFRSHIDGSLHYLSPEQSIAVQQALGSDIMMCFDECPPHDASKAYHEESLQRTTRWAQRCQKQHTLHASDDSLPTPQQLLFGIVQGGLYPDLRRAHARTLIDIGFDGYAVGGLAVGESNEDLYAMLDAVVPELPDDQPRYLMGVGKPENILEAVRRGIDMFDCVLPTRNARHGTLYVGGVVEEDFSEVHYETIHIHNERYTEDFTVLDAQCSCPACVGGFTKAYLRHLFTAGEPLALQLATAHNIAFFMRFMRMLREE